MLGKAFPKTTSEMRASLGDVSSAEKEPKIKTTGGTTDFILPSFWFWLSLPLIMDVGLTKKDG